MSIEMKLRVTELQRFCMHDGPGVRTTVFLKGCPLRCVWCHNPETQSCARQLLYYPTKCIGCRLCEDTCPSGVHRFQDSHLLLRESCTVCSRCAEACPAAALEICGKDYTVEELIPLLEKDRAFYGALGGVTLSGGEPLASGEVAVALLAACKRVGLSTAVETCGYVAPEVILSAIPHTDLFLWDVKDTNTVRHKQYTGVSNERILQNLALADKNGAKTRLRCILVNGVNAEDAHAHALASLYRSLSHCEGVELIPYHAYGGTKATFLGHRDNGNPSWIPTDEQIESVRQILQKSGVPIL